MFWSGRPTGITTQTTSRLSQTLCAVDDEILFRVLYYDCAPYQGHPKLPVSGQPADFQDRTHGSRSSLANLDLPFVSAPSSSGASSRNGSLSLRQGQYRTTTSNLGLNRRVSICASASTCHVCEQSVRRSDHSDHWRHRLSAGDEARPYRWTSSRARSIPGSLARELLWHLDSIGRLHGPHSQRACAAPRFVTARQAICNCGNFAGTTMNREARRY